MLTTFVIPVYQNELTVKKTYTEIVSYMKKYDSKVLLEFIFVNDGSTDNSLNEIKCLCEEFENVSYLSFSRNFGQVAALIAGYKRSKGDIVINLSADLQDPVFIIGKLIDKYRKGFQIAIAYREKRNDDFISSIFSKVFYSLLKLSNNNMPVGGFDFTLMSRKALIEFNKINERNRFFQGDILWLGFDPVFIGYERVKREFGKSQWTFSKKIKYFIDGLLNSTYLIIRSIIIFGLFLSVSSFTFGLFTILQYFVFDSQVTGWTSIIVIITLMGGVTILMLGLIGEYIWRVYDETRGRSLYVIDEESNIKIGK